MKTCPTSLSARVGAEKRSVLPGLVEVGVLSVGMRGVIVL